MFVYHNVKGIPSFTSKSDIFKFLLILHSCPGLFKVFFAPAAVITSYKRLPTRKGWKVRKGKDVLQWTSKQSWEHRITRSTLSTTFSKDIRKLFLGKNSIKTIPLHSNLRATVKAWQKNSKANTETKTHQVPWLLTAMFTALVAFLTEVLYLGQMRVSFMLHSILYIYCVATFCPIPFTFLHTLTIAHPPTRYP